MPDIAPYDDFEDVTDEQLKELEERVRTLKISVVIPTAVTPKPILSPTKSIRSVSA